MMKDHARLMVVTSQLKEIAEKDITPAVIKLLQELLAEAQALVARLPLSSTPEKDSII